jgi:hypothetical protein
MNKPQQSALSRLPHEMNRHNPKALSQVQRTSKDDELARAQVLDLIDITQPNSPDGSLVTRDHPLLSLSSLQTYCDLFFTRFNTVYPLVHMSTFDPSHVDTLLLTSVLLLGATYGEKDAHQLAVRSPYPNSPSVPFLTLMNNRYASTTSCARKSLHPRASPPNPPSGSCKPSS